MNDRPMYGESPSSWNQNYEPAADRYTQASYRRAGRSGLLLPALTIGAWQNLGGMEPIDAVRSVYRRAFDMGLVHFDLANNYGRPPGSAEASLGSLLSTDFRRRRDELTISTKAGYDMWPGPYGSGGSRKYLTASLDQSLRRLNVDYVDIFYSHRFDSTTPLQETVDALSSAVRQGKAIYVGISSYPPEQAVKALQLLTDNGTPAVAYQGSYSLLNRWPEQRLFEVLDDAGVGFLPFSPLNQGLLTEKYLRPKASTGRANEPGSSFPMESLSEATLAEVRALGRLAQGLGRTLPELAIQWCLRPSVSTSVVAGIRSITQLEQLAHAAESRSLSDEEVELIVAACGDHNFDPWRPDV